MTNFTFEAPSLFQPDAIPYDRLRDALHDAHGMAEHLASIYKFVIWLKSEMDKKRLATEGPFVDESGWLFQAPANAGFVICLISGPEGDNSRFHILVTQIGGASEEFGQAIEAILRNAGEITELVVTN